VVGRDYVDEKNQNGMRRNGKELDGNG